MCVSGNITKKIGPAGRELFFFLFYFLKIEIDLPGIRQFRYYFMHSAQRLKLIRNDRKLHHCGAPVIMFTHELMLETIYEVFITK